MNNPNYRIAAVMALSLLASHLFSQYYPGGFAKSKVNLWFDAADTNTMVRSSGAIASWTDKSNGLVASQSVANAAKRPALSLIDGKNMVEFNGSQGLDIPYNALLVPSTGFNVAQVIKVFSDAPTNVTDFRCGTFSTNSGNTGSPYIGVRYVAVDGKYEIAANRNNTGYYYSSYNDLRGNWTMASTACNASNSLVNFYINGGGNLNSTVGGYVNNNVAASIGNRNAFYSAVHWGVSETVMLGFDAKSSGRRILDLYLAAKWGLLDSLQYGYGGLFAPTNNAFTNNLVGIGIEAPGDTTNGTGSNNGLGLQNVSGVTGFLRKQGSYVMAADNGLTGTVGIGTGLTRWNRAWFLNKTDVSGYGGLLNVYFDFTSYGMGSSLDTANNNYYLLYNPTNGYFNSDSNYIVAVNGYGQNSGTKQLSFLLDGLNLATGYYTIVYAPKATSIASIPNLGSFVSQTISVSPSPLIPSVYAGNTFNYVDIDSSEITYPVAYYKIYAGVNGGPITVIDSTVGTPSYYAHYNLTNGNVYSYQVSAVYAPGKESALSDTVNGTPNNNTPTWLIYPQYSSSGRIYMAASAPLTGLPLKFLFQNVSGGGHSSSYQVGSSYTDSLLTNGNTYSYRFKFMDTVKGVATESGWSSTRSVLLSDSMPGGYTYNMTYLDPNTIYAPYGIGPANILPSNQDMSGLRYIKHVPAIGVHPRVYCNAADSTEIRDRLKNTAAGISASRFIHAYTVLLQLGNSGYNRTANYAKDVLGNIYFDNVGAVDVKTLYDSLAAGDIGVKNNYSNLWNGNYAKMAYVFSHEAMECWIYRNQTDTVTNTSYATRAQKLITALTVWAKKVVADNTIVPDLNMSNFGGLHNALAYDFLYDQMTKNQQDTMRMAILKTLPDSSKEHGCYAPSYTTLSNWATFGGEILSNIAVEGEPGYAAKDSGLLRGWVKTVWNFLTYGIYSTGDMYEGIGKNRLNEFLLVAMAKRGYSLLGHPNIRAYAQKYLPSVVQPFGYSLIGTDILGGTGYNSASTGGWKHTFMDIGGLKWAFPADSSVDFIWKNAMQRQYANQVQDPVYASNYYAYNNTTCGDNYGAGFNTHVPGLLYASNYFPAPVTSYARSALGNSKYYFDSLGGQAIMRSGFDSTSTLVFFACRQDGGGHTYANKNEVLYSAGGRIWFPRQTTISSGQSTFDVVSTTQQTNGILINDYGIAPDTGSAWTTWTKGIVPGKMVYYGNTDSIMTIAGDATRAYSYEWNLSGYGGIQYDNPKLNPPYVNKITDGWNKFRYGSYYSFDNIGIYDKLNVTDNITPPYYYTRGVERPYLNGVLKKVFRTVSLINGSKPYVVIADDIQRDNNVNNYKWITPIAPDLSIESTNANLSNSNYRFDVILKEPDTTGNRRLLIRVLNATGCISNTIAGAIDSSTYLATGPISTFGLRRFKIESNAVDPKFKVMLFPYTVGDPLPVTSFNADRSRVYVTYQGKTDVISFALDNAGRTNISLNADSGIYWTGAIDTIWNKAGNWSTNKVPTATDIVVIPSLVDTTVLQPIGSPNGSDLDSSVGTTLNVNYPYLSGTSGFAKTLTVQAGAKLTIDTSLQLSGDLLFDGTVTGNGTIKTYSTSTTPLPSGKTWSVNVEYNNPAGGQTLVLGTYKGLSLNASASGSTFTATGDFAVNGTLNISAGNTLLMGGYNMTGTVPSATGTGTLRTTSTANPCLPSGTRWFGTVVFNNANGNQSIPSGTYQNLTNSNTYNLNTAMGNVSIVDTLNLVNKSTLDMGTNLLGGTLKVVTGNGTLKTANTTATGALPANGNWAGTVSFYSASSQTVPPGTYSSLDLSGGANGPRVLGGSLYPTGTISLTGSLVATTGTVTPNQTTVVFKGNQQTVPAIQFYNLDLTGGFATQFVNAPVYISNVFTPASIASTSGMGTLVFNGTGAQTVPSFIYNGLTITGTRNGSVTIPNSLSVGGNLSVSGLSFTSGSLSFAGNSIDLNGTAAQTIDGNSNFPFNNVIVSNSTATVTALNNLPINGNLNINAGATLDLATYILSGTTTLTNAGTIRTQNTSSTPLPAGIVYGGTVRYNSTSGAQNIVAATYNNLDISGGTSGSSRILPNGGTITINGNYTPNTAGTLTNTGSTVVFTGSNSQTIASATSFANLQINKSGTANPLTLGGATTVATSIALTQGRVVTTATNSLTIASAASITGGSITAYIDGPLTRTLVAGTLTNYVYPVGNNVLGTDHYLPDTITAVTTAGNITVTGFFGNSGGSPDGSTLNAISTNEYWKITSSVANTIALAITPESLGSFKVMGQSSTNSPTATYFSKAGYTTASSINASGIALTAATDAYFVAAISPIAPPTITTASSDIPGGTTYYAGSIVTITGTNLSSPTSVTVGGQAATVTSNDGTTMVLTVPTGAASGAIIIANAGGSALNTGTFVANGFISNATGSWTTASTWFNNTVPTLGSLVVIKNPHVVTLNTTINTTSTNKSPNNLTINSGATLNIGFGASATGAANLLVSSSVVNTGTLNVGGDVYSGQFTSNGTFNNTGTVTIGSATANIYAFFTLNGASTNSGSITLNQFSTSNTLFVGNSLANTGTITINNNLSLTSASSAITGNGIIYGNNSNLIYNTTNTNTTLGSEWLTGNTAGAAGVPRNVLIGKDSANTVLKFGNISTYRQVLGALTIGSSTTGNGLVLGGQAGGDLRVGGAFTASQVAASAFNNLPGGLDCNGRMVVFNGSGAQTLTGPATGNPLALHYITIGTDNTSTNTITLGSDIAITAPNGGAPIVQTNLPTSSVSGGTYINSNNSAVSTRNVTLGTLGQSCTGTAYIRAGGSNPSNLVINGNGSGTLTLLVDYGGGNSNVNQFTINNANVALGAALTVKGAFAINAGSFDVGANSFSPNGTTTVGGTLTLSSATGTKTFTGLVTINSGGTWNNSGNSGATFLGGITNNGTFTGGSSGTYTFSTNNQALNGTISVPTATVTGITLTNNNTLTASTALSGTGTLLQAANSTLNIGGTSTITVLDATTNTPNTVNYTGNAAQTIYNTNYFHLGLSGTSAKTLQTGTTSIGGNLSLSGTASTTTVAGLTIGGNVTIGDGATLTLAGFATSIAGTTTVGGNTSGSLVISSATGTKTFTGAVIINTGATWNDSGNASITIPTLSNSGTFTAGTGTTTFTGNVTNSGTFTGGTGTANFTNTTSIAGTTAPNFGNVTIANGATLTASASTALNIGRNFTNNGTFVHNGGTVNFNGITAISGSSSVNFNNLSISASSSLTPASNSTINVAGNWTNAGTFTHNGSTVNFNGNGTISGTAATNFNNLTIASASTLTSAASYTINVAGTWTNNGGSFVPSTGSVVMNGTNQSIIGSTTFYNFTKSVATAATLTFPSGATQTFNGALVLNGASGNLLTLNASVAGTQAIIAPTSTRTVSYVSVIDNNNIDVASITATSSYNGGNNTNWSFGPSTYTWRGTVDSKWGNSANWSPATVPSNLDTVVVAKTGSTDLSLEVSPSVAAITINAGNTVALNTQTLSLTGNYTNNGTVNGTASTIVFGGTTTLSGSGTNNWGTVTINSGSTLTAAAASTLFVAGDWNNNGTFTPSTSTVNLNGNVQRIKATTFNNLNISTAGSDSATGALTVNGTLTIANGATLVMGTNQLLGTLSSLSGTGALQTQATTTPIPTGKTWPYSITYNNLTGGQSIMAGTYSNGLSLANTSGTSTATSNLVVNGNLTTAAGGTFDLSTFNLTTTGTLNSTNTNGTLRIGGGGGSSYQVPINQTWGGSVIYYGTGNNRIVPGTYNNLDLDNGTAQFINFDNGTTPSGVFNIAGTLTTVSTSFTVRTTTFNFTGNNQSIPAIPYYNLNLTGSGATIGNTGTTTVSNNLSLAGASGVNFGTGTIAIANSFNPGTTTTATQGTISFNGTGSVTIPAFNYNNLTITGARASSPTITLAVGTIKVGGTFTDSHTGAFTGVTTTNDTLLIGSTQTFTPKTELQTTLNVLGSSAGTVTLGNNLSVNGLSLTGGTLAVASTTLTINGNANASGGTLTSNSGGIVNYNQSSNGQTVVAGNYGNLTFSNFNKTLPSTGTIGVAGTFTTGTATGHTIIGSTFDFNGASTQTVPAFSYHHLTISGTRNVSTITLSGTINVAGNYNRTANGTGVLVTTGSNLVMNGTTDQTISAATAETLNNLTINNTKTGGGIVSLLTNNLTLNGTTNALTLTSGNLNLGGVNLTLNSTGVINSASANSYIVAEGTGKLIRKAVAAATVFPIGTAASFAPLTITNNTASDMTVGVGSSITNSVGDTSRIVKLQWSVLAGTSTTSSTVQHQFNGADGASSFVVGNSCELGVYTNAYSVSTVGVPAVSGGAYTVSKSALAFTSGTTYLHVLGNVGAINCVAGTYVGANGGDANANGNWCGGMPTSTTNVIITNNAPKLTANLTVNNINLTAGLDLNGFNLTVNGNLTGSGAITGSATSGLTVKGTGTLYFSQTSPGTTNVLKNLTINSSGTVQLGTSLQVTGSVVPTAGVLTSNGNLTLVSGPTGTARVSQGNANGGYITGSVTAQMFIPSKAARKYSFIGSPIASRVDSGWQKQIYITGPGTGGTACGTSGTQYNSNGFDRTFINVPSMFTYNATPVSGSRWATIPNTAVVLTPGLGYRVNIRGDRNVGTCADQLNSSAPAAPVNVVMSKKGTLTQGPVTVSISDTAVHKFTLLANPYACPFSFTTFQAANTGINNKMWTYSPIGNGNYTTYAGGLVSNAATGYNSDNADIISIGQAFFVEGSGRASTVTFQEAHKSDSTPPNFNYFGTANRTVARLGLYPATDSLLDETVIAFDAQGSKAYLPAKDAPSLSSAAQSLANQKENRSLAIAFRPDIATADTVALVLKGKQSFGYRLKLTQFNGAGASAVLKDNFLGVSQDLTANPVYAFTITGDSLSYGDKRFELICERPVPLAIEAVKLDAAFRQNKVALTWRNDRPTVGDTYELLRRSGDGTAETVLAKGNLKEGSASAIDDLPNNGRNVYRLKIKTTSGTVGYSNTAEIDFRPTASLQVSPNPVTGHQIRVVHSGIALGKATVRIINSLGQTVSVWNSTILSPESTVLLAPVKIPAGPYRLSIKDSKGTERQAPLIVK